MPSFLSALRDRFDALVRFVREAASRASDQELPLRGAALAFDSILCAAPLAALAVGLAGAFPEAAKSMGASLQAVLSKLLPGALDESFAAVAAFGQSAGHLSAVSLVAAIVSGANLSVRLEESLARAWGNPAKTDLRSLKGRFERHWIAITLYPVLATVFGWMAANIAFIPAAESSFSLIAGPLLLSCAFFILFYALPEAKPGIVPAACASALSTGLCLLLQIGFGLAWANASSYGVVYGAAAGIVGLIIWIWFFWLAVLYPPSFTATFIGMARARRPAEPGQPLPDAPETPAPFALEASRTRSGALVSISAQIPFERAVEIFRSQALRLGPECFRAFELRLATALASNPESPHEALRRAFFEAALEAEILPRDDSVPQDSFTDPRSP